MTRQAITTRHLGPTNTRGARVKATAYAGSVTLEWDHSLNSFSNHVRAAHALAKEFGWSGEWLSGGLPGEGYVFVNHDGADFSIPKVEA